MFDTAINMSAACCCGLESFGNRVPYSVHKRRKMPYSNKTTRVPARARNQPKKEAPHDPQETPFLTYHANFNKHPGKKSEEPQKAPEIQPSEKD